ncbi:MAG: ABC transporter permease [Alphaproteobacteria bacterium]
MNHGQVRDHASTMGAEAAAVEPAMPVYRVRQFGTVNWIGLWTLYKKEVMRFLKVAAQTVAAPVGTAVLFLAIFTLALGQYRPDVNGIPYGSFIAPGLIMMAILQNAFANTSSSLIIAKVQGSVVDFLMPPLSPAELTVAFVMGGATRGVICAIATGLPMALFVDLSISHVWAVAFFAVGASMILSLIGVIAGIWAEKFDHLATITNFLITPLSLLSGTFYSVSILPDTWSALSHYNPFFYFIDGFRYGFTGQTDGNPLIGVALVLVLITGLWVCAHTLLARGYRLKA